MKNIYYILALLLLLSSSCEPNKSTKDKPLNTKEAKPFLWKSANLYFLLVDRFHNGDKTNDINYGRTQKTAKLRGFEGGDIKGITQIIKDGYFTKLGVNAIWLSPIVEQIHDGVDEGSGYTYGYHGYWTKDWTALDKNFGTKADLHELVKTAHANGIKIVLDAVLNHTGPETEIDKVWPSDWVRTSPQCNYKDYKSAVSCTLVRNLPDILTESDENVALPEFLITKWKNEGRYEEEVAELDDFFARTKYPKAPKYYIIKWLTDYIAEFGIDGYRVDTVKHVEEEVWNDFATECQFAFKAYSNQQKITTNLEFYLVGEVYGYGISGGQLYDFGDKKVNYYKNGLKNLINFELKWHAKELQSYEAIFAKYDSVLQDESKLKNYGILNYMTSHDDGLPFDKGRIKPYEAATKLLLTQGTSQIYYGDESSRPLIIEGTEGDANLRGTMNWETINTDNEITQVLIHWQKLGLFRANHLAIGTGKHTMINKNPYYFKREYKNDKVFIGLDLDQGLKTIDVSSVFDEGMLLNDAYSNKTAKVKGGKVEINSKFGIVLLEKK